MIDKLAKINFDMEAIDEAIGDAPAIIAIQKMRESRAIRNDKFKEYLSLWREIGNIDTFNNREPLIKKALKIGREYNFRSMNRDIK